MAAVFSDLHDVAQVLTEHIREEVGIVDVQPGAPRDVAATTEAGARITLLYATPQPTHRSDPAERRPDGTRRPPPLSLSCFFLVTTTGADADDPIAAHHTLGRIMSLYHDRPVLVLPLSDQAGAPPGAFSELGEGQLAVVQVPMSLEQIDKIWTSVDVQLQPWTLLEVAPVQLVSLLEDVAPAPLVRPGGVGLEVRAGTRPLVLRVTPEPVRRGGRARIDVLAQGAPEAVDAGGNTVPAGDAALTVAPGGSPILLDLGVGLPALGEGAHALTVRAAGLISRRAVLRVAAATAPVIDAPAALAHDPATDLVLAGANLAEAQEAVLWPDAGLTAPPDVFSLPVAGVGAGGLTVPSNGAPGLADVPARRGPWRLAIRVGERVYTPYVLVELET
ncbi:MAG TPA: Pvc16 family protein [Solirubrobacteraceae bacterium]|nr:Pvc16 family protein [Solirubrobacteraceae bacterium]